MFDPEQAQAESLAFSQAINFRYRESVATRSAGIFEQPQQQQGPYDRVPATTRDEMFDALTSLQAARETGNESAVAFWSGELDRLVERARLQMQAAPPPPAPRPDFGAGARRAVEPPPDMNQLIRSDP